MWLTLLYENIHCVSLFRSQLEEASPTFFPRQAREPPHRETIMRLRWLARSFFFRQFEIMRVRTKERAKIIGNYVGLSPAALGQWPKLSAVIPNFVDLSSKKYPFLNSLPRKKDKERRRSFVGHHGWQWRRRRRRRSGWRWRRWRRCTEKTAAWSWTFLPTLLSTSAPIPPTTPRSRFAFPHPLHT